MRLTSDGNADRKARVYGICERFGEEKTSVPQIGVVNTDMV